MNTNNVSSTLAGPGVPAAATPKLRRAPPGVGSLLKWTAVAVLAALVIAPMLVDERFLLSVAIMVLINAIAAASLHLIIRIGHVSLAHAAFMGLGAYASVLTVMKLGLPFGAGVVAAFLCPAALALVIGPLVLRLTGKYFVLVTFLFGEIVRMVFVEWTSLTGGGNGIFGIPAPSPAFLDPKAFYYLSLAFAVVIIGLIARILTSEIGRAMDSIREGERLAECSGVPVLRLKVLVFVLGCGLAGIAGALQAHYVRYIDPTSFSMVQSLNLVVMNVIGGMYTLVGPMVGTIFLVVLPEMLRGYVEMQRVFFGVILIVVMAFLPGGLADAGKRVAALVERRFGARTRP